MDLDMVDRDMEAEEVAATEVDIRGEELMCRYWYFGRKRCAYGVGSWIWMGR